MIINDEYISGKKEFIYAKKCTFFPKNIRVDTINSIIKGIDDEKIFKYTTKNLSNEKDAIKCIIKKIFKESSKNVIDVRDINNFLSCFVPFFKSGFKINWFNHLDKANGDSPLGVAASSGKTNVVKMIIHLAGNKLLDAGNAQGLTPVHLAAEAKDPLESYRTTAYLIEAGAELNINTLSKACNINTIHEHDGKMMYCSHIALSSTSPLTASANAGNLATGALLLRSGATTDWFENPVNYENPRYLIISEAKKYKITDVEKLFLLGFKQVNRDLILLILRIKHLLGPPLLSEYSNSTINKFSISYVKT